MAGNERPAPGEGGIAGRPLLTIGHSNHPIDRFLGLLARHAVETMADKYIALYERILSR